MTDLEKKQAPPIPVELQVHNDDLERNFLGILLLSSEKFAQAKNPLTSDLFFISRNRIVFEAILSCYSKHKLIELNLVAAILREENKLDAAGGYVGIANLEQYVLTTNAFDEIHLKLYEMSQKRKYVKLFWRAAYTVNTFKDNVLFLNLLISKLSSINANSDNSGIETLSQVADRCLSELNRESRNKEIFKCFSLKSIIPYFESVPLGSMIILAARPSVGKSALMSNFIHDFGRYGIPSVVFSLEMTSVSMFQRIMAREIQWPLPKVMNGGDSDYEKEMFVQSVETYKCFPINIDQDGKQTPESIINTLEAWIAVGNPVPEIVAIDHLQLVTPSGDDKYKSTNDILTDISRKFHYAAKRFGTRFLILSQLSRDSEKTKRKPSLADLRGSGAIEQDADLVIFLHQDPAEKQHMVRQTEIIIAKNRNGPCGSFNASFHGAYQNFFEERV
jgi:replicative DNA helicase